MNASRK
ncbi:hypothetical protein D018_4045A, partial [Vibrio parahaemolyticus VP2007-007]